MRYYPFNNFLNETLKIRGSDVFIDLGRAKKPKLVKLPHKVSYTYTLVCFNINAVSKPQFELIFSL